MKATKKVDIGKSVLRAIFVADVYNNFSRLNQFTSLLVDEGLLPFILHLIDTHPTNEIFRITTESLANLSINRKNRREIASCGISSRLTQLFDCGSSETRAATLLLTGNLLSSGLFYDKVANSTTIAYILDNLLDHKYPKQFNAVSYCLCQLSKNESSCEVLVSCSIIPIILGFIRKAPQDSLDYLWTVVVNISYFDHFFQFLVENICLLLQELFEEIRFDASNLHQQMCIGKICFNLSKQPSFNGCLDQGLVELFVRILKSLFSSKRTINQVKLSALISLINFANYCPPSRSIILSEDLIDCFYSVGLEDDQLNVKYVGLINIISNEENCCFRLLELGVQKLLVSLQESFQRLSDGAVKDQRKSKKYKKGQSVQDLNQIINFGSEFEKSSTLTETDPENSFSLNDFGELGKELTASIIHNLALKRPILSPGVLSTILSLAKNCKTVRVLHCVRALANMSVHSKSRLSISKESKRIIPLLTVIMRCGCDEAEKVQHYCAIILCNILALSLEKGLLFELVKTGAVVDLMVVTLLRINEVSTKLTLGKALFNLLGRNEIRESLVLQIDTLSAIIELTKVEFVDLLELCMRAIFNITCDLKSGSGLDANYATKLISLKVPSLLISKLVYSPDLPGSMSTRPIRLLIGMALANMSFNRNLVYEIIRSEAKIADALNRIHVLGSEEATYCSIVILFNLSKVPECRVLASSKALSLLVEVLNSETTLLCTKLCVSTICNFSNIQVFHDQLTSLALKPIVNIISSPQLHKSIKIEAVQAVYNLVKLYPSSRSLFVEEELISAIWRLLKVSGGSKNYNIKETSNESNTSENELISNGDEVTDEDEERLIILVSHIIKEICEESNQISTIRKLLTDGIMNVILKLSKIELIEIKVDMAFSIYSLTKGTENLKILKRDCIDILFWLTIHDTLGTFDLILKNVSRTLRSFSTGAEESIVLVKQERFFAVLKELIKSKNEDVLWQTAGAIHNIMHNESCLKKLLEHNLIQIIFDIASSGYSHVKHVCSACLHMIPDSMPNLEDPMALELVLCLLEAEGDKFSEIGEKPMDVLPYQLENRYSESKLVHQSTNFTCSWSPLTCVVDNLFSPSLIYVPNSCTIKANLHPNDPQSISSTERHKKISASDYEEFQRDLNEPENLKLNLIVDSYNNENKISNNLTVPPPPELQPPQLPKYVNDISSNFHEISSKTSKPKVNTSHQKFSNRREFGSSTKSLPLISPPSIMPDNTLEAINRVSGSDVSQRLLKNPNNFSSSLTFKGVAIKK